MLTLVTPPGTDPVTLAEVKSWLRVDFTHDDSDIASLITAAIQKLDGPFGRLGRALITQTWELVLDSFPAAEIQIPLPPLIEVISVKYDDGSGYEQTISPDQYFVDNVSQPGWIVPNSSSPWPQTLNAINSVRIRFRAGYGNNATDVPEPLRMAMKMHIAHLYENRESVAALSGFVGQVPQGYEDLIADYRSWGF
jgi:uncharacterized phiE125 gp8 family phage protein